MPGMGWCIRCSRVRDVEVPGAAKVVLGAGAADGRIIVVPVEVDLELALPPPAGRVDAPGEIGADVVATTWTPSRRACYRGKRILAAELGMEVAEPGDVEIDLVGHRVVHLGIFIAEVLHGKSGVALEGHWPVGVEAAVRVDGDHRGTDLSKPAPAAGEEVPERDLTAGSDAWSQ